jgi:glycosyltransferase involved in cell wall biosynthesis
MKALIIHDYLDNIGGGEKLMLTLAREIGADLAALDVNPEVVDAMGFGDVKVIGFGKTNKTPPIKQVSASIKHWMSDFRKEYDFFIYSGNWSRYSAKNHHPNLWYCHTPVRAFYLDGEKIRERLKSYERILFDIWTGLHMRADKHLIKDVDRIIANSQNTRARIKKAYGVDSKVIYPGVDTKKYSHIEDGDFWLSVNRLYPEKRVHLQAEAFRKMPDEKLIVVGACLAGDHSSQYSQKLMREKPDNVQFLGRIAEDELIDLYGRCRGFICTAEDEDFGMTPVEAMSSGKPVIATREGGYLETVIDGETGVFIEPTEESLIEAVKQMKNPQDYRMACLRRAKWFDVGVFAKAMRSQVRNADLNA